MTNKQKCIHKRRFVNFFGGFGYFICSMQWVMTVVVYTDYIKATLLKTPEQPVVHVAPSNPIVIDLSTNNPINIIIIGFTLLFVIFAIYLFLRTPKAIVKTGSQIVNETARVVAPVVMRMQHIKEPEKHPKKLKTLRTYLKLIVKVLLVITPLIFALFAEVANQASVPFNYVVIASWALAGITVILFAIQYTLAKLLSIRSQDIL